MHGSLVLYNVCGEMKRQLPKLLLQGAHMGSYGHLASGASLVAKRFLYR